MRKPTKKELDGFVFEDLGYPTDTRYEAVEVPDRNGHFGFFMVVIKSQLSQDVETGEWHEDAEQIAVFWPNKQN